MKKKILLLFLIFCSAICSFSQFNCTGLIPTTVDYSGRAQHFTIPAGVFHIRIRIKGGDGGSATSLAVFNNSGGGAAVYGYFTVVPGDFFTIIIGQKGYNSLNAGGGGGASAVYKNGVLVLVAGGGGGEDNNGHGGNALVTTNGGNGSPIETSTICDQSNINNSKGGIGGNGGNAGEECSGNPNGGGGGGGLLSAGNGKINNYGGGGQGNIMGVDGGNAGIGGATGGFGWAGGGGGDNGEAGGGGGYSGGGGAGEGIVAWAGGGGSFITSGSGITVSGSTAGTGTLTPEDGSAVICALVAIVLPLKLHDFTAQQRNNSVLLKWKTSSEINTSHFSIERSDNNGAFRTIGNVTASSNTNTVNEYEFIDNSQLELKMVYRLKMVDNDGSYSYSPDVLIRIQEQPGFYIYPNPVADKLFIVLPVSWRTNKNLVQLIDSNGKILFQKNEVAVQFHFNTAHLPGGVYFVRIMNEKTGEQFSRLFQK